MIVEWLFLAVKWGCLLFVIEVFPDHTQLLFLRKSEHAISFCRETGEQVNLFEGEGGIGQVQH